MPGSDLGEVEEPSDGVGCAGLGLAAMFTASGEIASGCGATWSLFPLLTFLGSDLGETEGPSGGVGCAGFGSAAIFTTSGEIASCRGATAATWSLLLLWTLLGSDLGVAEEPSDGVGCAGLGLAAMVTTS